MIQNSTQIANIKVISRKAGKIECNHIKQYIIATRIKHLSDFYSFF